MRFHHIGMACRDIEEAVGALRKVYEVGSVSETVFDPEQDASVCLIRTNNGIDIELVSGKRVEGLLKKGVTYYHTCYGVGDLGAEMGRLAAAGAIVVSGPRPAKLFGQRRVAFLYTGAGLVELLEETS